MNHPCPWNVLLLTLNSWDQPGYNSLANSKIIYLKVPSKTKVHIPAAHHQPSPELKKLQFLLQGTKVVFPFTAKSPILSIDEQKKPMVDPCGSY